MIASCRLHRALHSKLMTLPTTPTICPHLHSLPVIMAWMLEVRVLTRQSLFHHVSPWLSYPCLSVLTCRREAGWHHSAVVHCGWIYRLNMCVSIVELVFMRARLVLPSPLPESSTCSPKDGRWEASWHDTCFPVELMTNHVLYFFQTVFVLELERQQAARMLLFFPRWSWCRRERRYSVILWLWCN